jgi:hypothetical protein
VGTPEKPKTCRIYVGTRTNNGSPKAQIWPEEPSRRRPAVEVEQYSERPSGPLLSDSWCVYFIRPNTLLLCIFLFCIFLLYRTDPQVEVQIRTLLKEAAIVSKMWTQANTLWFPEHRFKDNFYLGFFLAEFLFESSFFSKSRLCTWHLFSHFVRNLDRLASQPIFWIPLWGQYCGRRLNGSTTLQS